MDAFAVKRGHHDGTVLIDCGTARSSTSWRAGCRPSDRLAAAASGTCRDRVSIDAYAARTTALEAVQVADRFPCATKRLVVSPTKSKDSEGRSWAWWLTWSRKAKATTTETPP